MGSLASFTPCTDLEPGSPSGASLRVTYDTIADVVAAPALSLLVVQIQTMGAETFGDGFGRTYVEVAEEPKHPFHIAKDGRFFESTAPSLVHMMNAQSNGGDTPGYAWTPPPNLAEWDFYAQSQLATAVGTKFDKVTGAYTNIAIAFAAKLARARPECDVYVVGFAKGGILLNCWEGTGSYNMRTAIDGNMPIALAIARSTKINSDQWWQGDGQAADTTWAPSFEVVDAWLRAHSWYPLNTPQLIHAPSPYWSGSAPMMAKILATCAQRPATRKFVDSNILSIDHWVAADNYIHGTSEGRHLLGELAYNIYAGHAGHGLIPGLTSDLSIKSMAFGWNADGSPLLPSTGATYLFRKDYVGSTILRVQNSDTTLNSSAFIILQTDHGIVQMGLSSVVTHKDFRIFFHGEGSTWFVSSHATGDFRISTGGFGVRWMVDSNGNIKHGAGTTVIDADRLIHLRSYLVSALPTPGIAGRIARASNCRVFNGTGTQEGSAAGTGSLVVDNGSAWKIAGTNVTAIA